MKRFLTIILMIVLLTTTVLAQAKAGFTDTNPTDWYIPTITRLIEWGGITGYPDGTFRPNDLMTRAEFTKTLIGALWRDKYEISTSGHWATNFIDAAETAGILDKGEFTNKLDNPISRNEMAKMATRVIETTENEKWQEDLSKYIYQIKDYDTTLNNYKDYILKAYTKGIITGYPDGTFAGNKGLTRAEAATVVVRIIDNKERVLLAPPKEIQDPAGPTIGNVNTVYTGLVKEEDKPKDKIIVDRLKDVSNPKPGLNIKDYPDAPLEYTIDGVDLKLKTNYQIGSITKILTTNDIQRLQAYGYNWHTGYEREVPPRVKLGEYYEKHPDWADIAVKDYIPQRVDIFKNALVGWATDPNLVYKTPRGNYGVRGIFQIQYPDTNNPYGLGANKLYERDTEFRYANTTDGLFLRQVVYLSDWREVN